MMRKMGPCETSSGSTSRMMARLPASITAASQESTMIVLSRMSHLTMTDSISASESALKMTSNATSSRTH